MHTFQPMPMDVLEFNPFTKRKRLGSRYRRYQGKSQSDDRQLGWSRCSLG